MNASSTLRALFALVTIGPTSACDTFPSWCRSHNDCDTGLVCVNGSCEALLQQEQVVFDSPNQLYPTANQTGPVAVGSNISFEARVVGAKSAGAWTFSCTTQRFGLTGAHIAHTDSTAAPAPRDCTGIPGQGPAAEETTSTFTALGDTAATFFWQPTAAHLGTHRFDIVASRESQDATETLHGTWWVTISRRLPNTNLRWGIDGYHSGPLTNENKPAIGATVADALSTPAAVHDLVSGAVANLSANVTVRDEPPFALSLSSEDYISAAIASPTQWWAVHGWFRVPNKVTQESSLLTVSGTGYALTLGPHSGRVRLKKTGAPAAYAEAVMAANPLAYWRLDDAPLPADPVPIVDMLPSNAAALVTWGTVKMRQRGALPLDNSPAARLTGGGFEGEFGTLPFTYPTANPPRDLPLTIEAWVNLDALGQEQPIVVKHRTSQAHGYRFVIDAAGDLVFVIHAANNLATYIGKRAAFGAGFWPGNWRYVVATYDGSSTSAGIALYSDGAPAGEGACLYGCIYENGNYGAQARGSNENVPALGMQPEGSQRLRGGLDDVAIYGRALSDNEVQAHWQARLQPYCASLETVDDGAWHHAGIALSGLRAALYLDGHHVCDLPGQAFATGSEARFGRSNDLPGVAGELAEAWVYGANTNATDLDGLANAFYTSTSNRYRTTQMADVSTSGLLLHLDAANADRGQTGFANACTSRNNVWFDLSASNITAWSSAYDPCRYWEQNAGVAVATDLVMLGDTLPLQGDTQTMPFSVEAWVLRSGFWTQLIGRTVGTQSAYEVLINADGGLAIEMGPSGNNITVETLDGLIPEGLFTHVAVTYDGSRNNDGITFYVNGEVAPKYNNLSIAFGGIVGGAGATTVNYGNTAEIAILRVFGEVLTPHMVARHCRLEAPRFGAMANSCP